MQLISKFQKRIYVVLRVIDIYSKDTWVIPFKDKKGITITNAFQKILDKSKRHRTKSKRCKPNRIWTD